VSVVENEVTVVHPHDDRTRLVEFLWHIDIAIDLAPRGVSLVRVRLCVGNLNRHVVDEG
jgi:hypothetical protein